VQNLFDSNSDVQQQLNLLRLGGSQVINANLLTLPVGGGLLYVQPVYVQASSGTQFPSLQKVLVAFGDKIGFANTLNEALDQVFSGNSGASAGDAQRPASSGDVPPPEETPPGEAPIGEATPGTSPAPSQSASPPGAVQPTEAATPPPGATPSATATGTPQERLSRALQDADQALRESEAARIAGDWAAYGVAQDNLNRALEEAIAADAE
jgi:uncharacterized membrane protein (UPF0182 family)